MDELLDDPAFFEPYRAHFSPLLGRPSIPIETYLRMMFLKHRYRLGYETLCREVADSICWSRFCRIPLGTTVPHPTQRHGRLIRAQTETTLTAHEHPANHIDESDPLAPRSEGVVRMVVHPDQHHRRPCGHLAGARRRAVAGQTRRGRHAGCRAAAARPATATETPGHGPTGPWAARIGLLLLLALSHRPSTLSSTSSRSSASPTTWCWSRWCCDGSLGGLVLPR